MNRTYLRLLELSKIILLMFILSFLGGSRLYAQYFPIHTTVQWALNCERVDRVGDFNTESLSKKYGYIHFERGEGKYAFDDGKEEWYKKSVKTDRFYKPFAKGYIAPWKLVPSGETDGVTARYDGRKEIDLKKVRFVSEPNSAALPASLNETEMTWTISLRSVSPGTSYNVYALYEGEVIGKLRVVSYDKQLHKVTLVPINKVRLDKSTIEQELNAIYNPIGVHFSVSIDESMRGNYDWEVDSEKDSLLSTVGKSFWGYDKELKESTEMLNLQKAYQQVAGTLDGAYLFVLKGYHEPSGLTLNSENKITLLPIQMSMKWIVHVRRKLLDKGGRTEELSVALENKDIVQRYVFAIDKRDGSGYFVKLSNEF